MYLDWYTLTYVLAILAAILTFYAQMRVRSVYDRYSKEDNIKGVTGAEAAAELLEAADVHGLRIEQVDGVLSDHYDPQTETLRLSHGVYGSKSLSAIGIAAHEAAHAIQHSEGYAPLAARQSFVRLANFGSRISIPIVILGLALLTYETLFGLGHVLVNAGLLLFTLVVVLQIITLPVEFNASARAIAMLESRDILTEHELESARRVLNAAAWTYIAATLSAVLTLVRLLLVSRNRRR